VNIDGIAPTTLNEALLLAYIKQMKNQKSVKKYQCEICNKSFSKSYNRSAHMRLHTNEKPFMCDFPGCNKAFTWKSSLKSHRSSHGREPQPDVSRKRGLSHGDEIVGDQPPAKIPAVEESDVSSESSSHAPTPTRARSPQPTIEEVVIPLEVGEQGDLETLGRIEDVDIAEFARGCTTSLLAMPTPGTPFYKGLSAKTPSPRVNYDCEPCDLSLFSPLIMATAKLPTW